MRRTAILGAIGLVVGIFLYVTLERGYLTTWKRLSHPPSLPQRLILAPYIIAYQDPQSQVVALANNQWTIAAATGFHAEQSAQACDRHSPPFSPLAASPSAISLCSQIKYSHAEWTETRALALDPDGELWLWDHSAYIYTSWLLGAALPISGLLLGVGVSAVVWFARAALRKPPA
jgi:hypothetical protein